jgi:hypothetical protein
MLLTTLFSSPEPPLLVKTSIPTKVILYCDNCEKEFTRHRYHLLKCDAKFNSRNYCSRKCYAENRNSIYKTCYFCAKCKWIPKEKAIFKPKGTILTYNATTKYSTKKDNYYCPKCDYKLRLKKKK